MASIALADMLAIVADSAFSQGLQALSYWEDHFGKPDGAMLGLLVSCYTLGAISAIPFVPLVSDLVGRRYSIVFGSTVMAVGAALQASAVDSKDQIC
jgi:MFS family permease